MKSSLLFISLFFIFFQLFSQKISVELEGIKLKSLKTKIEDNAETLLNRINSAYIEGADIIDFKGISATEDGVINTNLLWSTSHFMVQEEEIFEELLKRTDNHNNLIGYEIRNIRMYFKEAEKGSRNKQVIISFDRNGNISDLCISIKQKLYSNILDGSKNTKDFKCRQIIIDFVEKYKTAFINNDLDFIESVFSIDSLTNIGRTNHKHLKNNYDYGIKIGEFKAYMTALKKAYRYNEYINIKFEDIKVVRHYEFQNFYGVTIKQNWHSSHYSDNGYLFLLINFKNIDNPIIQIRTWSKKDMFNIQSFRIEDFN